MQTYLGIKPLPKKLKLIKWRKNCLLNKSDFLKQRKNSFFFTLFMPYLKENSITSQKDDCKNFGHKNRFSQKNIQNKEVFTKIVLKISSW